MLWDPFYRGSAGLWFVCPALASWFALSSSLLCLPTAGPRDPRGQRPYLFYLAQRKRSTDAHGIHE